MATRSAVGPGAGNGNGILRAMKTWTVVLSAEPETDWFSVSCPAMPGALSAGHGREQALENMRQSMRGWYEAALESGFGPRDETPELVAGWIREILQDRIEEGWDLVLQTATVALNVPVAVG